MTLSFTEEPILNSLYEKPDRHWELKYRVPTDNIVQNMRLSEHIIPAPPSQAQSPQPRMNLGVSGISTVDQEYDPTPIINDIRRRTAPNQDMTTTDRQDQYHVRNVHTLKNLPSCYRSHTICSRRRSASKRASKSNASTAAGAETTTSKPYLVKMRLPQSDSKLPNKQRHR